MGVAAGHYLPAFGAAIHARNAPLPARSPLRIPLAGLAIGDGPPPPPPTSPLLSVPVVQHVVREVGVLRTKLYPAPPLMAPSAPPAQPSTRVADARCARTPDAWCGGAGWIDPINMVPEYPGLLYGMGMIGTVAPAPCARPASTVFERSSIRNGGRGAA